MVKIRHNQGNDCAWFDNLIPDKGNFMNDLFFLESLQEQIFFDKSKEYFNEVISSYNNGNYRSAMVMLWSVVVFDALYKLEHLKTVYNDDKAKNILKEWQNYQEKNDKNPKWELKVITQIASKTNIINKAELANLEHLQLQRHLSAHPVISDDLELYKPTKEITKAMIRIALEAILIRQPMYTDRIFNNIRDDLSQNRDILTTREDVRVFTKNKYLNRLGVNEANKIFKQMWKFVFVLDNDEKVEINRAVNAKFLTVLLQENYHEIENFISNNLDYFNQISSGEKTTKNIIDLFNYFPKLYKLFNDDIKLRIDKYIKQNESSIISCYFTYDDLDDFYNNIQKIIELDKLNNVNIEVWQRLFSITDDYLGDTSVFFSTLNKFYASARYNGYEKADNRFAIIRHMIKEYSIDNIKELLYLSDDNSQCYRRKQSRDDYMFLRRQIDELESNFDYSLYPNFCKVCGIQTQNQQSNAVLP